MRKKPVDDSEPHDQSAEASGEEAAGGSNPTPDLDAVDEIGEAIGITYADDEELRLGRKEEERDEHRWELNPASAEDYAQRAHQHGEGPSEPVRHMKHDHRGDKRS